MENENTYYLDQERALVKKIMFILDNELASHETAMAALFKAFLIVQANIIQKEIKDGDIDVNSFYRSLKMQFINNMDQSFNRIKMKGGFKK